MWYIHASSMILFLQICVNLPGVQDDGFSTAVFQVADGVPGRTPLLGPEIDHLCLKIVGFLREKTRC